MLNNKWSADKTARFLEICEQHPCVWDPRLDSINNRKRRKEAYTQIAKEMNMQNFGVLDVRAKLRSLRNFYTLQLAKISKRQKDKTYLEDGDEQPSWFPIAERFFNKPMQELPSPLTYRSNYSYRDEEIKDLNTIPHPSSSNAFCNSKVENTISIEIPQSQGSEPIITLQESEHFINSQLTKDIERHSVSSQSSRDQFDTFGAFIANELREIESNTSLVRVVKAKIQKAILESYEESNPPSSIANNGVPFKYNPKDSRVFSTASHDIETTSCTSFPLSLGMSDESDSIYQRTPFSEHVMEDDHIVVGRHLTTQVKHHNTSAHR